MGLTQDELLAALKEASPELLDPVVGATMQRFGSSAFMLSVAKHAGREGGLHETVCMADVETEYVRWLWHGYIPFGSISIIQGDPGVGKGTLTIDIAARLSRGCPMPCSDVDLEPMTTLLLTVAEDDLAATIKPRLLAAGADCKYVFAFKDLLSVPDDVAFIAEKIETHKARLVLIDPLNAYLSSKVDGHKDQDIRRAFAPLKLLAEQTGVAIILVHHLNKGAGQNAMYRGGGSIGITGAARCVLLVDNHPQDPDQRVIARVKGNLSAAPDSLAFRLWSHETHHVPAVTWIGTVAFTADQLLNPPKDEERAAVKVKDAMDFYTELLGDGREVLSSEVSEKLKAAGIAFKTAERARKELGVKSHRETGTGGRWFVSLPTSPTNSANTSQLALDDEHGEVDEVTDEDIAPDEEE